MIQAAGEDIEQRRSFGDTEVARSVDTSTKLERATHSLSGSEQAAAPGRTHVLLSGVSPEGNAAAAAHTSRCVLSSSCRKIMSASVPTVAAWRTGGPFRCARRPALPSRYQTSIWSGLGAGTGCRCGSTTAPDDFLLVPPPPPPPPQQRQERVCRSHTAAHAHAPGTQARAHASAHTPAPLLSRW